MWIVPSEARFFLTRQSALDPLILEILFNLSELKFRIGTVWLNFLEEMYQLPVCITNHKQFSILRCLQLTNERFVQTIAVEIFTASCINQE
jgi:hypothetical protein